MFFFSFLRQCRHRLQNFKPFGENLSIFWCAFKQSTAWYIVCVHSFRPTAIIAMQLNCNVIVNRCYGSCGRIRNSIKYAGFNRKRIVCLNPFVGWDSFSFHWLWFELENGQRRREWDLYILFCWFCSNFTLISNKPNRSAYFVCLLFFPFIMRKAVHAQWYIIKSMLTCEKNRLIKQQNSLCVCAHPECN